MTKAVSNTSYAISFTFYILIQKDDLLHFVLRCCVYVFSPTLWRVTTPCRCVYMIMSAQFMVLFSLCFKCLIPGLACANVSCRLYCCHLLMLYCVQSLIITGAYIYSLVMWTVITGDKAETLLYCSSVVSVTWCESG